ncbi:S8 family serine peptidase, partial [candidate division WOR-3 bacterium]|nr:S8 family serine peptidase [candidate division WOR-3 bacterium]
MKKILIIITILAALLVNAQYVRKSDGSKIHPSLLSTYNGSNKMWILFTDKGVYDSKDADQFFSINKDLVTEKSIWRRELRSNTLFDINDIPVKKDYINILEKMGIKIENSSKWLNGVSVKLTYEQLQEVSSLDFVYKIYPLAISKQKSDLLSVDKEIIKRADQDTISNKYNYGSISAVQIEQIYVNMLHNKSYTGKGVIVAIFDTGFKVKAEYTENGLIYKATHKALDRLNIIYTYSLIDDTSYVGMMEMTEDELAIVDHGTKMLALMGAYYSGDLISPAFGADYMLFKTEDLLEEVTSEEDNWIRAAEMADSLGVDIISSSVGYKDWYPYTYMTGDSCLITKAANIAVSKGIIVVNAIGNITEGVSKADTSIIAPADGEFVMAVGGVDDYYLFSSISATGPPYDKYLLLSDTLLDPDTLGYDLDT